MTIILPQREEGLKAIHKKLQLQEQEISKYRQQMALKSKGVDLTDLKSMMSSLKNEHAKLKSAVMVMPGFVKQTSLDVGHQVRVTMVMATCK